MDENKEEIQKLRKQVRNLRIAFLLTQMGFLLYQYYFSDSVLPDDALLSRDFSIESRDFSILDRCKFCSSTAFFKDCRDPDSLERV